MTRWIYLVRFFLVVPPMPLLMVGAFAVVTIIAGLVIVVEPSRASGALTPILLLQVFACSSGFDVPARRGHYDLLLTRGEPRQRIVFAHFAASAFPGVACWLLLAILGVAVSSGSQTVLLELGTVAAVTQVSTIAWATTVRLPRFSGAIGWLLIISTVSLAAPSLLSDSAIGAIEGPVAWARVAWAVLAYPPLLVGLDLQGRDALIVVPGVLFAMAAVFTACGSLGRRDIPLEAAQ
jgi:hypothetical protein